MMPQDLTRDEVIAMIVSQTKALSDWYLAGHQLRGSGSFAEVMTESEVDHEAVQKAERILMWCKFMRGEVPDNA